LFHRGLKVREPVTYERQSLLLDAIDAEPAPPLVTEQAGGLKNLKVPGRRLPCMRERASNLSRCHCATVEKYRKQHAAACGMGQSTEYILIGIALRLRHGIVRSCHW